MSLAAFVPGAGTQAACQDVFEQLPLIGCSVLVVDDVPDNQRLFLLFLMRAGAEVELADNGRSAVEQALAQRAAGRPFDVVLMDVQMPVMDGLSATRELRAAGYAEPIVALTAYALAEERERCLAAGCSGFLSKPISGEFLVSQVGRFAEQSRRGG